MAEPVKVVIPTGMSGPVFTIELRPLCGRYVVYVDVSNAPKIQGRYQFQGRSERHAQRMAKIFIADMQGKHWKEMVNTEARRAGRMRQCLRDHEDKEEQP